MAGVENVTGVLERANEIGRRVDAALAAGDAADAAQR
jgi:hypothetical protein